MSIGSMWVSWMTLMLMVLAAGCQDDTAGAEPDEPQSQVLTCTPEQNSPYDSTTPYLGIHGDAGNSDIVPCESASAFEEAWHVLKGHAIAQPNTFSPDGATTYVTAFPNAEDPCSLFALNAETGEVQWCKELARNIAGGSVEVDSKGMLYVAADAKIFSYTPEGEERWVTPLDGADGLDLGHRPFGLHFTQSGYVATVTIPGNVFLLDRETGSIALRFDVAAEYGFVAPEPALPAGIDILSFFPKSSEDDFVAAFGTKESANITLGNFLGVSGNFTDNTVAVSIRDEIYVQGGGPTAADGSIIQLILTESDTGPTLEKGWYILAEGGSAASPSVSRNGRYMVMSDGASTGTAMSQAEGSAYVILVDLEACNANTDSEPDPNVCGRLKRVELERGSMSGAPPIADDGTVYYWESGLDFANFYENGDLFSFGPDQEKVSKRFDAGRDWSSVMTVTNNHLIGSTTSYVESEEMLMTNVLPATTENYLSIYDRQTLEPVWEAPLTDDSTSTTTIDKAGSLYVTLFGLLNIIATEERPTLGLVKFKAVQ